LNHQDIVGTAYQPEDLPGQRVMRVRVNPRTRRAAARQLFSEEQGGQQAFVFTATCPTQGPDVLDEAALLVAAARFIRELGRARRRGQGECLISLLDVSGADLGDAPQTALLNRFEEKWLRGEPTLRSEAEGKVLQSAPTLEDAASHPLRCQILVRLEEPLVVAKRAASGNRFQSRETIPGTVLRGALANRVAQTYDLNNSTTYNAFLHLFLRDGVRFPTLHPLQRQKSTHFAAVPMPRDGFACKVYKNHPVNWGTQEDVGHCPTCGSPTKAVRGSFYPLHKGKPEPFAPEQRVEMHIRVDPNTGRVEEGQLFDYMALEAGQYFAGEIQCADEQTWQLLQSFTGLAEEEPFTIRLGKATRRGYGKVKLWVVPVTEKQESFWNLLSLEERVPKATTELTMTLLTDAIVQDNWGRFATGFDEGWLKEELSLSVSIVEGRDFAGRRITDGYNTQWHLPAWRALALEAGSTVRLRLEEPVTSKIQEQLQRLEQEGIGERRNEGYGQIVFNHPLYNGLADLRKAVLVNIPEELELTSKEEQKILKQLHREWRDRLDKFTTEHKQQWRRLEGEGQPVIALARWLMQNRYQSVPVLIEEITTLGIVNDGLVTLIQAQEQEETEDEYGDRPQQNRLGGSNSEEKKALWLVKALLRELNDKPQTFWPNGIRMLADRLAIVAEMEKEG
jgi:CRISPR-associated protein Csx10